MGNDNSSQQSSSWIRNRYRHIQSCQLQDYGSVSIFKKKEQNYDYIVQLTKNTSINYLSEIQRQLLLLSNKRIATPFLKIFSVIVGKHILAYELSSKAQSYQACCSQQKQQKHITIYMQLLTYSLKNYISFKKSSKYQISLKQYSYILKTALAAAQRYEQWSLTYLQLDLLSNLIFIKPNGQIKIMPFRSRFMQQITEQCQCIPLGCGNHSIIKHHNEIHNNSYITQKRKEGKYIRQIKQLSLQLFSTINPNIDNYVRTIPRFNSKAVLTKQQLNLLKATQNLIINSKSLTQIYNALRYVEDDLLAINQFQDSSVQIQVSSPQSYKAFFNHLQILNNQKADNMNAIKKQQVSQKIFQQSDNEEQSNTSSNPSPKYPPKKTNSFLKPQNKTLQYFEINMVK